MSKPPLAGKPPFATDEPDSFYETPPITPPQRIRAQMVQPATTANSAERNKRTSAYDIYEDYIPGSSSSGTDKAKSNSDLNPFATPQDAAANRNSSVGAMLMNMDDMDDDSDDEDFGRRPAPSALSSSNSDMSKNAALAAAVTTSAKVRVGPSQPTPAPPPPASPPQSQQPQRGPHPIAAPQPGYPAPIAALNLAESFAEKQNPPQMRQIPIPPPLRINPNIQNPFEPQNPFSGGMPSPFVRPESTSPHPLLPPVTPITPVFIRPKAVVPPPAAIKFDESSLHDPAGVRGMPRPPKAIMRSDAEETPLRSRGEKGDDFWRRFSMVAKLEQTKNGPGQRKSSWLSRTQSQKDQYSRWVWIVGITLLLIIIGAVGCGVYFTRNSPDHQQPKVFGGSADQAATYTTSATGKVTVGPGGTSTILHVSPTHVVDRRGPEPTLAPVVSTVGKRMHIGTNANAKRRLDSSIW
ncbi:hypothetical protein JR316_0007445 [Psilocybe cubensis]|uniref:Uncharacterized protein n=2 Tax=Psilocybe cubensis TaxID=181762 RepID=A0A8H7XSV8_PSICU|nr:hypothetical protein JR316_0007445 [Psilocybe cubensis]KAH9480843.1 hypothetical protein JR316_0007445 [Psilocybe cubensis]